MKSRLAAVFLLLWLVGCVTEPKWSQPGASAQQMSRDAYECRQGALRAAIWDERQELYALCMQGRGYHAE
jgi:hypothetical protein